MNRIHSNLLREAVRQMVIDNVTERAKYEHKRNYHKLHVWRDGSVVWSESIDRASDIIDHQAADFRAVESVACVGTGSYVCNCDYCNADYDTADDAIEAAVADSDLSAIEEEMLAKLDAIEVGYFDDEPSDAYYSA